MKPNIHSSRLSTFVCLSLLCGGQAAFAAVSLLNTNFESNTAGDTLALPWSWSVETFANNAGAPGGYLGGYYPGDATSAGIHAIVDGQTGPQGVNALKVYGDYGFAPNHANNQWVRTNIYQNKTLAAGDVADGALMFTFDYAAFTGAGGLDGTTLASVYFQLLSPDFNTVYTRLEVPVTSLDTAFQSGSLSLTLDGTNVGNQLQWGFTTSTQNYSASAFLVDNLAVASVPEPSAVALGGLGLVLLTLRRRKN